MKKILTFCLCLSLWGVVYGLDSNRDNSKVPYTGARENVDLGTKDMTAANYYGDSIDIVSDRGAGQYVVKITSQNGSTVMFSITGEGTYVIGTDGNTLPIHLMQPTTFYGSSYYRGHDIKGIDDVDAQSYTYSTAQTRYYGLSPAGMVPSLDTSEWVIACGWAQSGSSTDATTFRQQVKLPTGAIITGVTTYWYVDDGAANADSDLKGSDFQQNTTTMATMDANGTGGYHSVTDTTITYPGGGSAIDNESYTYCFETQLDPNNNKYDARFNGAVIVYTIMVPLP